jgi:transposase
MDIVNDRCAGLDVHKKTVVACVITPQTKKTCTFGTMTDDLLEMCDWLTDQKVTHVAMESTGVYWKPVYNLLEVLNIKILLVNAQHVKAVPGRKTDVKDAEWLADLLRYGLLRASYVPDRNQRELRELVRYRRSLTQEKSRVMNRIQKVLEGANIKLSSVATNVVGVTGRAMLKAISEGADDTEELMHLIKGRLNSKKTALREAMKGLIGPHQRMMLRSQLRHLGFLEQEIEEINAEIATRMASIEDVIVQFDAIPGVGRRIAEDVLAEMGSDMSRFPTSGHLASWAKVCPGNNESAGKRINGKTAKGNPWLRSALVEAAWTASRSKNTYLSAQFKRISVRRGAKRAASAVAHTILVTMYQMLARGTTYNDLGGTFFDQRNVKRVVHRSVTRLENLGFKVSLVPA